ncbi:hypothetical protein J1605_005066 [Eschrichtius robustus]|uniref:Glutamate decarboxylase 2 n=1 Tax=Eschrichtius robustus TaxID=9764 RepID=A0AB34HCU7_ESCRO|nr:hypothetical protein J1605_005066 [Eschrichtius robustus]
MCDFSMRSYCLGFTKYPDVISEQIAIVRPVSPKLSKAEKGFVPFLVSATAGTTVYGAFDPLLAVADICKKYKIWMHVDVSIP